MCDQSTTAARRGATVQDGPMAGVDVLTWLMTETVGVLLDKAVR
ncbi:hypothetical protein [Mycobacterium sp. IDR2000157661]|nr:hypothetical protein [Mycobacterium sp. IDR2000157661]